MKNQQGVTVFIALLILSSMVVLAMAVSDLVVRTSQSSKKIGLSEIAYHTAETCIEKALYQIEKTFDVTDLDGSTGELDEIDGAIWSCSLEPIVATDPFIFSLEQGESFQLELNFYDHNNDLGYPNSINVNWTGGNVKAVALTKDGDQETHTNPFYLNQLADDLYVLRITNQGTSTVNVSINASGGNMPEGIIITCIGEYKGQRRILDAQRNNSQIY